MIVYSVTNFDNKSSKQWIKRVLGPGTEYKWNTEFIKSKDLHYNERRSHNTNVYTKGKPFEYIIEFNITEKGIYQCHNISDIDSKYETNYLYFDPDLEFGEIIKSGNILGLLDAIKKNELIDTRNLHLY